MQGFKGVRACVAVAVVLVAFGGVAGSAAAAGSAQLRISAPIPQRSTVVAGESLPASLVVHSGSRRRASATRLRLLASLDRHLDPSDVALGLVGTGRLAPRMHLQLRVQLHVPALLLPAAYHLLACLPAPQRRHGHARRPRCSVSRRTLKVTAGLSRPGQPQPAPAPPDQPGPVQPNPPGGPQPNPPGGPQPNPPGGPQPNPPGGPTESVAAQVSECAPQLVVGALADSPSVTEGDTVAYSASVRNEPSGSCLEVAGGPTVSGSLEVSTSAPGGAMTADVAMWIEIGDGSTRDVLPASAGLSTSGSAPPEACPGGSATGCTSAVQAAVGNVSFSDGTIRTVAPGSPATVPFRFFPELESEDLDRIATTQEPVRLVAAVTFADGAVALSSSVLRFAAADELTDVQLDVRLADGSTQPTTIGSVAPGGQADLPAVAQYTTSAADPDTVAATFQASATSPRVVVSQPTTVTTVVTNDPSGQPDVFPTAAPDAATVGTTPTVLVTTALRGEVTSDPVVTVDGDDTSLGTLHDDGLDGDLAAADGVWSGRVDVPLPASLQLRVSVALDGVQQDGFVALEALPAGAPTGPAPDADPQTIADGQGGAVLSDRIAIRMADGRPYADVEEAAAYVGGTVVARTAPGSWQIGIAPVASKDALDAVLGDVSTAGGVIGAEPVGVAATTGVVPNDPSFAAQGHLTQIGADRAWIVDRGDARRVVIAVIDSGVDRDHPDLRSRLLPGHDFANGDDNPEDSCGHGTHVAGIAAAATNNGVNGAGVDWNAAILPVKVFPDVSTPGACGSAVNLAAAIRWAVDHGASVINMSLAGKTGRQEDVVEALEYAWLANRVVVVAAGNDGGTAKNYPAGYDRTETFSSWFGLFSRTYHTDVLAVGNVQSNDTRNPTSTHGSWVDVSAPGTDVLSTYLNGGTTRLTGTSMATPVVAGLAALMLSREPLVTEEVRSRLVAAGRQIAQDVGPRVDAFESVFNGSFEAGLATWRKTGTVETVDRLGPITPRAGSRMLSMSTGPADAQSQATVRKVLPIRSDALRDGHVTLSLNYDYVTEEYPEFVGSQFNDTFTITLHLPNGETRTLANESVNATAWTPVSGIDFPGGDSTVGQSGWRSVSTQVPASALGGDGDLTLEVRDLGDDIYDSVALVDAVRLD